MTHRFVRGSVALAALLACGAAAAQTVPGTSIPYAQVTGLPVTSPAQAGLNLLTLGYGNILVSSSPAWGGAIYDYAVNGSGNLVNRVGAGTLWQSMLNVHLPDGTFINPTEAGDKYDRGAAVTLSSNSATVQSTRAAPLGFLEQPGENNLGGTPPQSTNVAIRFTGMTIGKELTLAFNGDNNVARYVAKVYSNVSGPRISGNLPVLYLPGNFRHFTTYNAATGAWLAQTVPVGQQNVQSQDFGITTNCGGVMAENADRTVGVALYACRPGTHNGGAYHLAFSNLSPGGNPDPLSTDTTALMAQIVYGDNIALPAGESSLPTYIVVCKAAAPAGAACVQSMANLYSQGY